MSGLTLTRIRQWVALALTLTVAVLSGCAAPLVSARVTSFQHWPSSVEGQTYQFVEATPEQKIILNTCLIGTW